ncbi:MAG: hypothetical protein JWL92_596 [Candidatus Nomurabacteria bacterium]|nr:hypothetical protein [Candidatus Nomurabacteria bacterium]
MKNNPINVNASARLSAIRNRRIARNLCIAVMVIIVMVIIKILAPTEGKPDATQSYTMIALMALFVIFYFIKQKQSKILEKLEAM